tara:strand:+ start:787 stop:1038 length:252 start_codon:yes stop_codon:yes gene_type:complete
MTACFFIQKKQLPRTDYQGLTAIRYAAGKGAVNTKTQGKFMNQRKEEELVKGGNAVLESAATVLACICGSMLVLFIAILISKL